MLRVTCDQVVAALQAVGVCSGDGLLIHSAIQYLGRPVEGLETYWAAFWQVLGEDGTLATPAFNFAFARGEPYDPQTTPSVGMSVFSEYVRQRPEARRTSHPMQSLAVVGRYAVDLASRDTPSAFDPGSPFERMVQLGFKVLLLGADIDAVSMIHYSEQRLQVPYRYWKEFTGQVRTGGEWQERTYRMYVRDMAMDVHLTLHPVMETMRQRLQWQETTLNYGKIASFHLMDFVTVLEEFLCADPWSLTLNREEAISRKYYSAGYSK